MNCKKCRELIITDYIDSELSPENTESIDEHIVVCPDCRRFKEDTIKNSINPLRTLEKIDPPPYVWHNIRNAVAERSLPHNRGFADFFKRYMPGIPAISVAAAVVLIFSFMFSNRVPGSLSSSGGYAADESYFAYLYEGTESTDTEATLPEDEYLYT